MLSTQKLIQDKPSNQPKTQTTQTLKTPINTIDTEISQVSAISKLLEPQTHQFRALPKLWKLSLRIGNSMLGDKTQTTAEADSNAVLNMTEIMKSLSESDDTDLPKEWRDFEEHNLDKFLAEVHKEEAGYDSLGIPCSRVVITDSHAKLQPRSKVSLQVTECPQIGDNLDTEYIALSREALPDQLEKSTTYKMVGNEQVGVEVRIVPKAEVTALEAQGWEV